MVLKGPSLANDMQAILSFDNKYNADFFLDEKRISQVLQSNDVHV